MLAIKDNLNIVSGYTIDTFIFIEDNRIAEKLDKGNTLVNKIKIKIKRN